MMRHSASSKPAQGLHFVMLLLGFTVTCNIGVNPSDENMVRLTDIASLLLLPLALFSLAVRQHSRSLVLLGVPVSLVLVGLLLQGYSRGDVGQIAYVGRAALILGVVTAFGGVLFDAQAWRAFLCGLASGTVAVAALGLGQLYEVGGVFDALRPADAQQTWEFGRERFGAIWGHPNEMAQIQMLGIVAAIVLARIGRSPVFWWAVALGCLGATYWVTQTRASLIVAAMVAMVSLLTLKGRSRLTGIAAALVVFGVALILMPSEVYDRFFGVSGAGATLASNAADRLQTWSDGLQLARRYPLGLGVAGRTPALDIAYGILATHNSFIALALGLGLLPAAIFFLATLRMLYLTTAALDPGPFLFALALVLLFLIEDSIFSISTLIVWTAVYAKTAHRELPERRISGAVADAA